MSQKKVYPTKEQICEMFVYDNGKLVNRVARNYNSPVGKHTARLDKKGYLNIKIYSFYFKEHRLVWNMFYGEIPDGLQIDHMNGDKTDNRIENLRLVSNMDNCQNKRKSTSQSKTGVLGVSWYKKYGCYIAQICVNYKKINLGYYDTIEEAHQVYLDAKRKLHKTCTI